MIIILLRLYSIYRLISTRGIPKFTRGVEALGLKLIKKHLLIGSIDRAFNKLDICTCSFNGLSIDSFWFERSNMRCCVFLKDLTSCLNIFSLHNQRVSLLFVFKVEGSVGSDVSSSVSREME